MYLRVSQWRQMSNPIKSVCGFHCTGKVYAALRTATPPVSCSSLLITASKFMQGKKQFSALLDCAVGQAVDSAWSSHALWPARCRFGSAPPAALSALRKHQNDTWHTSSVKSHFSLSTQTGPSHQRPFPWATMISQGQWDLKLLNKLSPLCLVFSFAVGFSHQMQLFIPQVEKS